MFARVLWTILLVLGTGCAPASAGCELITALGERYAVCRFDPAAEHIETFNLDAQGNPFGSFSALSETLLEDGKSLVFAMNAGMFNEALKPIGLYVEDGRQSKAVNRRNGRGNFHLKPNGVFYVKGAAAGVLETEAYVKRGLKPDFASQSGPMLVIDGAIHPAFSKTGTSFKRRNGVGVDSNGNVVFAISDGAVRFYDFAALFRDELGCENALFLDGSVSSLFSPELNRHDSFYDLGPMVGVVK